MSAEHADVVARGLIVRHFRRVFDARWSASWYSSAIEPLLESIATTGERRREAEERRGAGAIDDSTVECTLIIETQIGFVLVLCQEYLERTFAQIRAFQHDYEACFGRRPSVTATKKHELLHDYGPVVDRTEFSMVAAIDALASYFKHHAEWGDREQLIGEAESTATILEALGADVRRNLYSASTLSRCVRRLGFEPGPDLRLMLRTVDEWKQAIGELYAEALELAPMRS